MASKQFNTAFKSVIWKDWILKLFNEPNIFKKDAVSDSTSCNVPPSGNRLGKARLLVKKK